MKKIISLLIVVVLLAASVLATLPASAAAVKTYNVNWAELNYTSYYQTTESSAADYENMFTVTKTATSISSAHTSSSSQRAYIATTMFAITATTQYEYVFKVKNNNANCYSGVPFAFNSDYGVYMVYGGLSNDGDAGDNQSEFRFVRGKFDYDYPGTSNRTNKELDLDTQGYSTVKVVYNGFNVDVYAMAGGSYFQMNKQTIVLPEGSKLTMGVYSRENNNSGKGRTVSVKDAVVSAMNQDAATNLVVNVNGSGELQTLIAQVEKDYVEANYTAESYGKLKTALAAAKTAVANSEASKADITAAKEALEFAVLDLELKKVDTTALKEAIAKAKALKEVEYTAISYKMVMDAVKDAEALMETEGVKQSQIDAATEAINGRIDSLKSSGVVAETEGDDEADDDATQAPATEAPATEAPATEAPAKKGGCGSAVATTAVVVGLVATLGTALVVKKRD